MAQEKVELWNFCLNSFATQALADSRLVPQAFSRGTKWNYSRNTGFFHVIVLVFSSCLGALKYCHSPHRMTTHRNLKAERSFQTPRLQPDKVANIRDSPATCPDKSDSRPDDESGARRRRAHRVDVSVRCSLTRHTLEIVAVAVIFSTARLTASGPYQSPESRRADTGPKHTVAAKEAAHLGIDNRSSRTLGSQI